MLLGMIPLPVSAAEDVPVATDYVDVLRMSFLEGDKLVAAAYGDDQKSKDMHLGDKLYLQFTWPYNEEALDIEVIGPTSGALVGIPFLQHITPAYTDSERIYKPIGMTPFEIKVQLGLRSDYRELWAVPGLGYNGMPMSMLDQASIALSNASEAMGLKSNSNSAPIQSMSLTGIGTYTENSSEQPMLLAEEDAAVENKDASEAAPAPEATPTPATPTPLPSEEPAEETQNEELEPSAPTATPVETESPEATLEPTPVVTELPDPTPSVVPEVTPMPSNTPKVDGASNSETDDAETGEPLAPTPTPDVATAETAEDLSPQEIAAKVQENFGYSDQIMAYMTSDEIAALAFKMGIKVDREFYEYFDARTPMLMDAIDDDSSTIYNFIAWDGRVCVGANDVRYMAPGDYVISVIGLTSGLVKSISFTLPDNGQGEIIGGNPDGSLTTAQMRAMAASAVQLPTGILTGNSTIARCVAGDPVDMITGGLDWSYTDLSMEGDKQMGRRQADGFRPQL